jgi:hypothetical protein
MRLAEEHGDALGIILVESQGATFDQMERFVWDQGWMGNSAMWTSEAPVDSKSNYLPSYAFIDAQGNVIARGNPIEDHGKIEDMIAEQLKAAQRVPENTPKSLEKAWKEFLAGKPNKAIEAARKVVEKGAEDVAAAQDLILEFTTRLEKRLAFIERQADQGFVSLAKSNFDAFQRGASGVTEIADAVKALDEKLASEAMAKELAAEQALESALSKCYEDGLDEKSAKRLAKLAESHPGTKAAERAQRLSRL